jgi:xanthine phosphoribosyltransferase
MPDTTASTSISPSAPAIPADGSTTADVYCLSWTEFHRDCRALARQLLDHPWRGIVGIARGGLIPATILARELDIRLIDSLCIASYDHTRQGEPQLLKGIDGDGEGLLLVDDLVDTGVTARFARERLPKAVLATVYAKPRGRELAHYWQREFAQATWVHFPWDVDLGYSEPLASRRR